MALVDEGTMTLTEDHKRVHWPSDVVLVLCLLEKTK